MWKKIWSNRTLIYYTCYISLITWSKTTQTYFLILKLIIAVVLLIISYLYLCSLIILQISSSLNWAEIDFILDENSDWSKMNARHEVWHRMYHCRREKGSRHFLKIHAGIFLKEKKLRIIYLNTLQQLSINH